MMRTMPRTGRGGGELQELGIEVQFAASLVQQHRFHPIRQHALGDAAEIMKRMHHAPQQVVDVLALGELQKRMRE